MKFRAKMLETLSMKNFAVIASNISKLTKCCVLRLNKIHFSLMVCEDNSSPKQILLWCILKATQFFNEFNIEGISQANEIFLELPPVRKTMTEMSSKKIKADQEYKKNPELKKEDIIELKKWALDRNLPDISDEWLILFHHSCMFNMKATQSCIEKYYSIRMSTPDFFKNRDVSRPELQKALKVLQYSSLPVKDPNGNQIIYHGLQHYDPSKYDFNDAVKLLTMAIDACLHVEGTVPGYIFLLNMKGVRLNHLQRLNVSTLRTFFNYIQEGMPIRVKAIHLVNTLPIIDKLMFMIKPFIKKELLGLIHFHCSNNDEVQKFIPKNCLPSDFGGALASVDDFHETFCERMKKLTPYFLNDESLVEHNRKH